MATLQNVVDAIAALGTAIDAAVASGGGGVVATAITGTASLVGDRVKIVTNGTLAPRDLVRAGVTLTVDEQNTVYTAGLAVLTSKFRRVLVLDEVLGVAADGVTLYFSRLKDAKTGHGTVIGGGDMIMSGAAVATATYTLVSTPISILTRYH